MTKKLLKISVLCVLGLALLVFLVIIIEPNNIYVAEGRITKLRTSNGVETMCDAWKDIKCADNQECKEFENKDCNQYKYTKGLEITYYDQTGKRISDLSQEETSFWWPERRKKLPRLLAKRNELEKVFTGPDDELVFGRPYLGCMVTLYYLRGAWFRDRSWFDPVADVSMCRKPQSSSAARPAEAPAK